MDINFQDILDMPYNDAIFQLDYCDDVVFCHEESKTNKINNALFNNIDETVRFNKSIRSEEFNNTLRNTDLSEETSTTNIDTDIYNTDNNCFIIQNELIQMNSAALNVDSKVNLNEDTKIEMVEYVSEASYLSSNFNFSNNTMSSVDDLEKFLETKQNKAHKSEFCNTTEIPLPTHTETDDLFNNINTKDNMEMVINSTVYENSKIPLPILTFRNFDEIINDNKWYESRKTHNDHNYAMVLSRDDFKEFSIVSGIENNGQGKMFVNTVTETNELDSVNNSDHDVIHETNVVIGEQNISEKITKFGDMLVNKKYDIKNSKIVNFHSSTTEGDKLLTNTADLKVNKIEKISMENEDNTDASDCEGYNSSDFEFIDETEAYMDGIVLKSNGKANSFKFNRPELVSSTDVSYSTNCSRYFDHADSSQRYFFKRTFDLENEGHCRNNHVIPQDENYLELFAQPWTTYHEVEHKAFHSSKTMHVEVDNIGFNVSMLQRLHEENKVGHVFEQEAKENAKKIISMYPLQNRKRRRRL